jgi:hypothetical protein
VAAPSGGSAVAGLRPGLVLTSGKPPIWRHMASQPCAAWTYGTGFGQKWRHLASHGVTALCRLDLRHETRARPGRQAHPAIATVSGRPPPRNPSPVSDERRNGKGERFPRRGTGPGKMRRGLGHRPPGWYRGGDIDSSNFHENGTRRASRENPFATVTGVCSLS